MELDEKAKVNILYVDDEENNLQSFKAAFRRDYNVFLASSGFQGQDVLKQHTIHIIVTDQRMPGMTGVEFLESILDEYPDAMRILLTGYSDIDAVVDAVNKGKIYHYHQKPWDENLLRTVFKNAYAHYRLVEDNKELTQKLIVVNNQLEFMLRQKLLD